MTIRQDDICTSRKAAELLGVLMSLEIKGLIVQEAGSASRAPGVLLLDS